MKIESTETYTHWLDSLRDLRARARIQARVERLAVGNAGDAKPVGERVSELRIDYDPGYRVYYTRRDKVLVSCCAAATNAHRMPTSRSRSGSPEDFDHAQA